MVLYRWVMISGSYPWKSLAINLHYRISFYSSRAVSTSCQGARVQKEWRREVEEIMNEA